MKVWLGNPWAVEAFIADDGQQQWRSAPGERVTEFYYPEDTPEDHPDVPWTPSNVAASIIGQLSYHMQPDQVPAWVESDNDLVRAILCDHFRLDPKTVRPKTWGDGSWTSKHSKKGN